MESILEPFAFIANMFYNTPEIAFIPALLFGLGYFWKRSRFVQVIALLWVAYALEEFWLKSNPRTAYIRLDLLLIYPVLAFGSLIALVLLIRRSPK